MDGGLGLLCPRAERRSLLDLDEKPRNHTVRATTERKKVVGSRLQPLRKPLAVTHPRA